FHPVVWRISPCGLPAGAVVPGQRGPHRWLRQHDQESADAVPWRPRGHLLAPRAPQAPEETGGDCLPHAPRLALAVPYPAVPGTAAQALAGVCAGPTVTPLC